MRLKTFGGPALEGTTFSRPKSLLLLAYLAAEGGGSRAHLRELFWPDVSDPAGNLRFALSQIRAAWPEAIREEGGQLHLGIPSDVSELLHAFRSAPEQVPMLYQGAFLEGLRLDWSAELEDWGLTMREHLAGQVRTHLIRQAAERHGQGKSDEVSALLRQAWRLPGARPLDAEELQALYALAALTGDELAGPLRQEARELEVPLEVTSRPAALAPVPSPPGALPLPPTSFVGRQEELRELHALLDDPDTRLLTLLGPGGTGKTRLALELARGRPGPPPVYVTLETVATPDLVPGAVALALGLKPSLAQGTLDLLKEGIGTRPLLLILDNFEQVLEAGAPLAGLLDACPGLQLLVTSRERLGLPQETLYPVGGLAHAGPDSEAAQLFVSRARRANARFRPTPDTLPVIAEICDRLEGSPLGIELAAAWVRSLPPAQIAAELALGPELLEAGEGKARRGLRTVFEQSWARLSGEQQRLASALSVFAGGLTRLDAAAVAGATLRPLLALVDAAFLRVSGDGRYALHPLLRHFLRQRLAADVEREAAAERAHAAHFTGRALDAWTDFYGGGRPGGQERSAGWGREEYANLQAALGYAERHGRAEQALDLTRFQSGEWINRGLMRDGIERLDRLLEGASDPASPSTRWGWLTRAQLQLNLGQPGPELTHALDQAITLARQAGDGACLSQALSGRGLLCAYGGDFSAAREHLHEAERVAADADFPYGQAAALVNLGAVANHLHDLPAVRSHLERGVALAGAHGFDSLEGGASLLQAEALLTLGDYASAERACLRTEALFLRLNRQHDLGFAYLMLGIAALWKCGPSQARAQGRLDEAQKWLSRSAQLLERGSVGQKMDLLRPGQGDVLLGQEAWPEAQLHFQQALDTAQGEDDTATMMNAHHGLTRVAHAQGHFPTALEHFRQMLSLTSHYIALLVGLEGAAATVSRLGGPDVAARVWGATAAFRQEHAVPVPPYFREGLDREQALARERLTEESFNQLLSAGGATELGAARELLLNWQSVGVR
ncbi:hypothetical protein F8S09_06600 [Deinococcus sp. SDU3-2]|uniref:Tetratricopeptide repeat protein n=1 Tax=Deinococcus terrestris TaxID=2651870 RepID=A0A7X1TRF7_9DEIO|nr:hypothetical protein [Deinococcus terrestris]MPY66369.1 hypothetical protein [Deinococcus terrestris]